MKSDAERSKEYRDRNKDKINKRRREQRQAIAEDYKRLLIQEALYEQLIAERTGE